MASTVALASKMVDVRTTGGRLAVCLLAGKGEENLCTALINFKDHLLVNNAVDIFVFSLDQQLEEKMQKACGPSVHQATKENVFFLPLAVEWRTPVEAEDPSLWGGGGPERFTDAYRRMGHWRLFFQFEFARQLGYKYVLQVDDDSVFSEPVPNLVDFMSTRNITLAGRNLVKDLDFVMMGLAELARYFIVTESFHPTQLFDHCSPKNIDGLTTERWDREVIYGNLVVYNLDMWFQEPIQRFLRLVQRSGGHFRYRWNEQAVVGMIWQMFVKAQEFHLFDFGYNHPGG